MEGLPVLYTSGLREHLSRTFYIPWSDQGPFLNEGIPAINLGSRSVDNVRARALYHTPQDTVENLDVSGVATFGRAAERIVRTLDELTAIPDESMDSFRLGRALFIGPVSVLFLHTIVFSPLFLSLFFHFKNHSHSMKPSKEGREILACIATFCPFIAIYLTVGLFRKLQLLPAYALYPATVGDPVLVNPPWGMLCGIFGAAFIIAVLCVYFYMFAYRSSPKQEFNTSKPILLCLLIITAILALLHNSYWAATFLSLPCWIWTLVGYSPHREKRILNWIWILAAGIPCCALLWLLAPRFGLSLNLVWYQILALNTGLFSGSGYFLGAFTAALGIRFMIIQMHSAG